MDHGVGVVREAGPADKGGVRELMVALHGEAARSATLPVVRQEARTFVVGEGDDIVGMAVVTFVDYGHEPYGMIEELVVRDGRRGAGVGSALLDRCREWLGALGAEVVFVSAADEQAVGFYRAAGFNPCTGPWLWSPPGR
jgi:GNAT superfamily N-acetyltransferase